MGVALSALRSWLRKTSIIHPDRAERRAVPGLAAYHWDGSTPTQSRVIDISSSGAYLLTEERWNPGEFVSLTLQRRGPLARIPEHRVSVQAKTVRIDQQGVGVSFVLPPGTDLNLWRSPFKLVEERIEPEDILREFRIAAAVAFLRRICPSAAKEIRQLLREGLSSYRLDCTAEIALHAEEMLVFEAGSRKMRGQPRLVRQILEDGSWAENEQMQNFWAGLLATSCTIGREDSGNLLFIELMSQLTATQTRIFATACSRARTYQSRFGAISARPLICSPDEMMQIAGVQDLVKINHDLDHLGQSGLLSRREKPALCSVFDEVDIAPTGKGLAFYARCNAHRGSTQDFYGPIATTPTTAD
jgi:PilZ domain